VPATHTTKTDLFAGPAPPAKGELVPPPPTQAQVGYRAPKRFASSSPGGLFERHR
jgi:hypothetical protein